MPSEPTSSASFSASRRWGIFFSVIISIIAMCALVVMLNYLGARYYKRFYWSTQTDDKLSPQTLAVLKSITNQVKVIVYFDKTDDLYDSVTALLREYEDACPKISIQKVDYLVDAIRAQQVKAEYNLAIGQVSNVVIFDCEGRHTIIPSARLSDYAYRAVTSTNDAQPMLERHVTAFEGEKWFTAALLNVVTPKRFKAYFLQGDGEPDWSAPSEGSYVKFAQVLDQNNVEPATLRLLGTNSVPADCNLLIIPGPRKPLSLEEQEKIRQYLNQGGRMFAMFNYHTEHTNTGLESILAEWNVKVYQNRIDCPPDRIANTDALSVYLFATNHPLVVPLLGYSLAMVHPRALTSATKEKQGPEAPNVSEVAFTGAASTVGDSTPVAVGGSVPVMVTVEKGAVKGVLQERGSTAILVTGDSEFLSNGLIDVGANRDFAGFAINWLLDRTQLVKGIGPHPVAEYKLQMTNAQMNRVEWIFLAAMPGSILAVGGLVWFRRRR